MAGADDKQAANGSDGVRLGDALKSAREAAGLSIRRAAERAQIHHEGLRRIERGEQQPMPETLLRLASSFELDEADLFALAGYRLPERLPNLPAYLRAKYRMPDEAAEQLTSYFGYLQDKYDIEPKGDPGVDHP
jgi:transcriptional regulator with XRE-family HTH domain